MSSIAKTHVLVYHLFVMQKAYLFLKKEFSEARDIDRLNI